LQQLAYDHENGPAEQARVGKVHFNGDGAQGSAHQQNRSFVDSGFVMWRENAPAGPACDDVCRRMTGRHSAKIQ
jgi:hypothetical protein